MVRNRANAEFDDMENFSFEVKGFNVKSEVSDALFETLKEEFIPLICDNVKAAGLVGGPIDRGPGPRLSDEDAWGVREITNMHFVIFVESPVGERAFYLEYGTGPVITADGDYPMRFVTNVPVPSEGKSPGDIIYRMSVEGVNAYGFFRKSIMDFDTVPRVERRLGREVTERVKTALRIK
jgi:hypothetical protein